LREQGVAGWFKLEKVPHLIAAGTVAILIVSVIHDAGFFLVIGREFQDFLSPADYISGALSWSPSVGVATVIVGAGLMAVRRYYGFETRRIPKRRRGTKRGISIGIFVVIVYYIVAILYFLFDYDTANILAGPFILIGLPWMIFWGVIFSHEVPRTFLGPSGILMIGLSAPVLLLIFSVGIVDARFALKSVDPIFAIDMAKKPTKHVVVIRNIDRGVIYHDPIQHRIAFIKWADIVSFSRVTALDERPNSCVWFGLNCQPVPGLP